MNGFRDVAWGVAALVVASVAPAQAAMAQGSAPERACHAKHHGSHSCRHSAKRSSSGTGGATEPTMPGTQVPAGPGAVNPPSTNHFPQPHPTAGAVAPSDGDQKHGAS